MNEPLFGISVSPAIRDVEQAFAHAQLADELGLELVTLMDHPYNRHLFDTWTLMAAIAARTRNIRVATNVASLPLRPPAMLAKMAASLQEISGGRVILGLGAGGFEAGIRALGGVTGSYFSAFKDGLAIIQGLWASGGKSFDYEGKVYSVKGARFGPIPSQSIPIWVGASGPKMMDLIGRKADGVIVSNYYEGPERLLEINAQVDAGAEAAGRDPGEIRRAYNLMGTLEVEGIKRPPNAKPQGLYGGAAHFVERIGAFARDYRQDAFIFWPSGEDKHKQIRAYAKEVAPEVRKLLTGLERSAAE